MREAERQREEAVQLMLKQLINKKMQQKKDYLN